MGKINSTLNRTIKRNFLKFLKNSIDNCSLLIDERAIIMLFKKLRAYYSIVLV